MLVCDFYPTMLRQQRTNILVAKYVIKAVTCHTMLKEAFASVFIDHLPKPGLAVRRKGVIV
jgi:hypothetical protein